MKPSNPRAFPNTNVNSEGIIISEQKGMELRDYYANSAMQAIVSREHCSAGFSENEANQCYIIADMMLNAR